MKKRLAFVCIGICVFAFILGANLFSKSNSMQVSAPAVNDEGFGRMAKFSLSSRQGSGSTFVDVKYATYDPDSESALAEARKAARKVVGGKIDSMDISLSTSAQSSISGGSATVLWAIAIIALAEEREMNSKATISAVFCDENYEELCPVGGIEEKIWAAQKEGKSVFVVSEKQVVRHEGEFKEIGIEVKRAKTFGEAINLILVQ